MGHATWSVRSYRPGEHPSLPIDRCSRHKHDVGDPARAMENERAGLQLA
jgi:hypothetical protein